MPLAGLSPKEIVHEEMHRFKHGQLHSGSHHGPLVKNRKQAIAIALSEARRPKRAAGGGLDIQQLMQTLQNAGVNSQMMPWAIAAMAGPAMYGLFNQPQSSQPQTGPAPLMSGLSNAGQSLPSGQSGGLLGSPIASGAPPSTQSSGQPPVVSSTPAATPPVQSMNGQPPGSWTPPTFSAGNWSSAPGRDMGGGMTRPPPASWMVRNEARSMLHSGPINSIVPGRTDRHNVHVGSGAYVMPADAVSHLGQNNTKAGQAILSHMFGKAGPYGMGGTMSVRHGPGAPKPPRMPGMGAPHIPKFQSTGGGKSDHTGDPVPIVVAGGEFTIPPEAVAAVGGGDIKRGHRLLDKWVLSLRQKHIATLKGLPPPAKS